LAQKGQSQKQAGIINLFRRIHRDTTVFLFLFFFIISVSGVLLGWKKNSGGYLLPETRQGTSSDLSAWLPLDSLIKNAEQYLHDSISPVLSSDPERIDIRKDKGVIKLIYSDHFYEVQLDGVSGELLQIKKRRSDFIEKIHDGSIIDYYLNTGSNVFKLIYTSLMGISLLLFTVTGFWLWYGPKRMKAARNKSGLK
jgi:uncharacterized iron-regulated membrane protein